MLEKICFFGLKTRLSFTRVPAGDYIDFFFFFQLQSGLTLSVVSLHDRLNHKYKFPYLMANCHLQHFITEKNKTLYAA